MSISSSLSTQIPMPSSTTFRQPPAEGNECPICLNTEGTDIDLKKLECHHPVHPKCIVGWIPDHADCPTCRAPIRNPIHLTNESLLEEVKLSNDKKWLRNVIKSWDETYVPAWDTPYKNVPVLFRPSRPDFCVEAKKRLMAIRFRAFMATVTSMKNTVTTCFR